MDTVEETDDTDTGRGSRTSNEEYVTTKTTTTTTTNDDDDDECDDRDDAGDSSSSYYAPPAVDCPLFVTWSKLNHRHRHRSSHDRRRHCAPSPNVPDDDDEVEDDAYHRDDARCYDLRGCIGTLFPKSTLDVSLSEYAITSALYDRRFEPITADELPYLRVCVSLLIGYEECATCHDWIVGVHGIIIEFVVSDAVATTGGTMYGTTGKGVRGGCTGGGTCTTYTATYLPEVAIERGWDREEAVISLVRKSGYRGAVTSDLLSSIRCTRYRTSACHALYREYCRRGRSGARRRMRRGRRARYDDAAGGSSSTRNGGGGGGDVVVVGAADGGAMIRRRSRISMGPSCINL
ncbi:hypothetical protein ACHAXA_009982 [Cyclostephanos tholiformis]|uniref:AMMECR1 domain-containing protein n=1 Tax=Cyclostephanos tholiformis TaxID=382380 RepID=A0ABD3RJV5_9STRA